MKFKKFILSSLTMGLLSNSSLPSYASILSENGRYEIFEGNNITIDNVLEEDTVDIEIEGNTLANGLSYNSVGDFSWIDGTIDEDGYIEIETDGSTYQNFFVKKETLIVKPSTEYTFFVEIRENTLTKVTDTSVFGFIFGASNEANMISLWTENKSFLYDTKPGVYKFTLTTKDNFDNVVVGDRGFVNRGYSGRLKFRYMILEGNHTDKNIYFFKDIKSVGELEDNKLKIKSENKNLAKNIILGGINNDTGKPNVFNNNLVRSEDYIPVKPNVTYTISNNLSYNNYIYEYDINKNFINFHRARVNPYTFTTTNDTKYILFRSTANEIQNNLSVRYQIEEGASVTEYQKNLNNSIEILIKEPLRGLPNGVKDKIIKRNGQWVVERNCGELILDGSETWKQYNSGYNENEIIRLYTERPANALRPIDNNYRKYIICDKLYTPNDTMDAEGMSLNQFPLSTYISHGTGTLSVALPKEVLSSFDEVGFKSWLSLNKPTIIYQLAKPTYEPLNIDSTLDLYLETAHISNNSVIPANMKVIIDRVANRAAEAIELAKANPTIENISQARMWTNLMKESLLKDEFQNDINEISEIADLEIEKKTATANLDLYVKSNNSLTMSLSTNSVTFENYSGVEDLEMLDAVSITINSSLPYSLNAYMLVQMSNADSSNIMDANVLNIRDNTESNYSQFVNTTDKVLLKDDCMAGNNNMHDIDLKLSGTNLHKADVYKTTIKFEAEQK